jgi:hypothetical protein
VLIKHNTRIPTETKLRRWGSHTATIFGLRIGAKCILSRGMVPTRNVVSNLILRDLNVSKMEIFIENHKGKLVGFESVYNVDTNYKKL